MVDVTVRGAGILGLSIAWACVQRGAAVRIVDPYGIASGSSGGIVGALAPHVPENWNPKKQFQLESLLMAETYWQGVQDSGGLAPGYARLGRLQPIADAKARDLAAQRGVQAQTLWQGRADWQIIDAPGDWAPHSATGQYVFDTLSARIHPRQACLALQAALAARGVTITADQPAANEPTIWATGLPGLQAIDNPRPVGTGVKGQAALLGFDARALPQLFADALHIVPHGDGTVAIGSTSEREYRDPASTDAQLDVLVAKARAMMPALTNAPVLERWAGVRPRARSRAPMLGPWPGRGGHFIANGGFKIGFGMAPKIAEVMADLVLEGRDAIPEGFQVHASL